MQTTIRSITILILTVLTIASCSSAPVQKRDPYNDADAQRSRAGQTQDEMSRDTSR